MGRMGRTSASKKISLSYCVNRKMCSFVKTRLRSGRPIKEGGSVQGVKLPSQY